MKKQYLVYQITNLLNNKIYIGVHMTRNLNDNYFGSGTEIKENLKKIKKRNFKKDILFIFDNKEEMLSKEKELVTKEFCMCEDTYNRVEGGGCYTNGGMVNVRDKNGNTSRVYLDDPRYLSGELVFVNKNKVVVKDKENNIFQVDKDDPRYLSGELISHNKGIPKDTNQKGKKISEETKRKISEAHKGKKISEETRKKISGREPYNKGKKHTDEAKKKMSEKLKGREVWNKGIPCSEETKEKIRISKNKTINESLFD